MKAIHVFILLVILIVIGALIWFMNRPIEVGNTNQPVMTVLSFEDCVAAGYPVMESSPRQCRTPDGRTYAEELSPAQVAAKIRYTNATANNITVESPQPGAVTGKEFTVVGKARGPWYSEATFPIQVLDKDGKVLASGNAQAQGEWMTEEFVPYKATIKVPDTYIGAATLVLKKDNPSGLPQNDASVSFPFTIEY